LVLLLLALGGLGVAGIVGHSWGGKKQSAAAAKTRAAARFARIDSHTHISPDGVERALQIMETWGIVGMVNLSGMSPGPPHHGLETQLAAARASGGRIAVFANAGFMKALRMANAGIRADYGNVMAEELALSKQLGAIGLKIPKGLGLGYPTPDGKRVLPVDDPGLDPLFEKAGELGMPVAIHTGDPKAFWLPADAKNERWDELQAHPEWSFRGQPVPSWEELYAAFERRVARHPKTTFIGVHFGNDPEDPDHVAQMLDKYPNLYIDTAARVPEIGRQDAAKMRLFYEKYQDRILFGTDLGVAAEQDGMMYGSNGANPPTLEDEARYFTSTWRYFETRDKQFESPTPIQGRWKIDGVGLPEAILRKIYFENAARVLKWRPPPGPVVAPHTAPGPAPAPASPPPAPRPKNEPRHEPVTPSASRTP
jgi:predicted TIM-barrel fold metal-dependent hydrolase